ncbi:secretin and TonB N-terminal domain-containing protein [Calditrichota bacterium LG25]
MRNLYVKIVGVFLIILLSVSASPAIDIEKLLEQRVSPSFEGVMLKDALRLFAKQNSFNYVFTGDGKEVVNVRLTNVPIRTALEYILKPNGYHYLIKDNVMIIKPLKDEYYGELQTKIYHLQYIDALKIKATVSKFLSKKGKLEALLTEKTTDKEPDRSNVLIVSDLEENLAIIDQIIQELDAPLKQVLIEVRLIETLVGDNKQLGLKWPTSIRASVMGAETTAPISNQGQQTQGGEQTILAGWYELPETPDQVHLGVLTVDRLQAALNMLASDNRAKLISNPKVTTVNNQKAIIRIGTTVPIPEIQRSVAGDLYSYKERDVSMRLEVIPIVGKDNKITLKLHPIMQEIIGYVGTAEAPQPIISVREVETTVVINDGETVAIGGLVKETKSEQQEGIWLLSSIPILGYLFKHTTIKKEKNDLLIFITSKVLEAK